MKLFAVIVLIFVFDGVKAQNLNVSEEIFNTTVKINGYKSLKPDNLGKKPDKTGTGFFFEFRYDSLSTIPFIVTNKHVIQDCNTGRLIFNSRTEQHTSFGEFLEVSVTNFEKMWLVHPTEDLAILPLQPILGVIKRKYNKNAAVFIISESFIPSKGRIDSLKALEDVIMVGYPKGFSDSLNNLPIARKGMTATPYYIDYNKERKFLLDIPIYSGSSGSPVFFYQTGSFTDREGRTRQFRGGQMFSFLGIATESKEYAARGKSYNTKTKTSIDTITWLPFEIGVALKSSVLQDFKDLFKPYLLGNGFSQKLLDNIK